METRSDTRLPYITDHERAALVDSFSSLKLRDKVAVSLILSGGSGEAVGGGGGADGGGGDKWGSGEQAALVGGGGSGGARKDAGDFSGNTSVHDMSSSRASRRGSVDGSTCLPTGDSTHIAAAISMMTAPELRACEAQALRIQSNVRAWLARISYKRVHNATLVLQAALRRRRSTTAPFTAPLLMTTQERSMRAAILDDERETAAAVEAAAAAERIVRSIEKFWPPSVSTLR